MGREQIQCSRTSGKNNSHRTFVPDDWYPLDVSYTHNKNHYILAYHQTNVVCYSRWQFAGVTKNFYFNFAFKIGKDDGQRTQKSLSFAGTHWCRTYLYQVSVVKCTMTATFTETGLFWHSRMAHKGNVDNQDKDEFDFPWVCSFLTSSFQKSLCLFLFP